MMAAHGIEHMFEEVHRARDTLRGKARVTPVIQSSNLDEQLNASVFLKCESFQRTGSFKFRGAFNALSRLSPDIRKRGVITYSSGNHGQALALAGRLLGIATTVVMPEVVSVVKRAATQAYGAEIVTFKAEEDERESLAQRIADERGLTLIPPFDHRQVIAGQGTAALELMEELGLLDVLLIPCGGGGLLSGSAVAVKHMCPPCRIIGVEPEQADDAYRSFHSGRLQRIEQAQTIADGLRPQSLGELTFPLIMKYVDDMVTVSEAEIVAAVRYLFYRTKLVVEPSGAVALAALLGRRIEVNGRIGILVSGGNVDGETMHRILG